MPTEMSSSVMKLKAKNGKHQKVEVANLRASIISITSKSALRRKKAVTKKNL